MFLEYASALQGLCSWGKSTQRQCTLLASSSSSQAMLFNERQGSGLGGKPEGRGKFFQFNTFKI